MRITCLLILLALLVGCAGEPQHDPECFVSPGKQIRMSSVECIQQMYCWADKFVEQNRKHGASGCDSPVPAWDCSLRYDLDGSWSMAGPNECYAEVPPFDVDPIARPIDLDGARVFIEDGGSESPEDQ